MHVEMNDVNGGAYDGFGNGQFGDPWAYTQFERTSIPNYWSWAKDYVLCDNFFASVGGPSYPNHFFLVAGQSGGALDNPENIETRQLSDGRTFKSWGCDAVGKNVFVLVKDERGNLTKHDSCFTFRTVPEQLEDAGVPYDKIEQAYVGYVYGDTTNDTFMAGPEAGVGEADVPAVLHGHDQAGEAAIQDGVGDERAGFTEHGAIVREREAIRQHRVRPYGGDRKQENADVR